MTEEEMQKVRDDWQAYYSKFVEQEKKDKSEYHGKIKPCAQNKENK